MSNHDHIKLTASELSLLFMTYTEDTVVKCVTSYFLEHVEDPEVRACVQQCRDISETHINYNRKLFETEGIPVPAAFSESDVNVRAARLYSDEVILQYMANLGNIAMGVYSHAIAQCARLDIRQYYTSCLGEITELYNRCIDLLQEKGLYIRAPYIPYPKVTEFVKKQHFISGWMGDQRPLTSTEISFLYMNLQRNSLGSAVLMGFTQIAQSKAVKKYMTRGLEIAKHHCAVFSKFLSESNIPIPISWSLNVMESQDPVFSDRLLMFHTLALNNVGLGFYGQSLAGCMRRDVSAAYNRLMVEVGEYGSDGLELMIDNGWMEKPPSAPDRKDLARG